MEFLNDFFEGNSVSMAVMETYEDFCNETNKKTALNQVRRELLCEYESEPDQYILFQMTLYYCALKKNFVDEKSQKALDAITKELIQNAFGDDDSQVVFEALESLKQMLPIKPVRAKNSIRLSELEIWKKGAWFLYPLTGKDADAAGLNGYYAALYCLGDLHREKLSFYQHVYVSLYHPNNQSLSLQDVKESSFYLPSCALDYFYRWHLFFSLRDYPKEKLIYLGNELDTRSPSNEILPPAEIYTPRLSWTRFDELIAHKYQDYLLKKRIGHL